MLHPSIVAAQDRNSGQPSPAAPAHTADDPHKVLNFNEGAAARRSLRLAVTSEKKRVTEAGGASEHRHGDGPLPDGDPVSEGTVTAPAAG
jgi:hypothetical protein